jgi:uridine phosphorylase
MITKAQFEHFQKQRYEEWLRAAQSWVFGAPDIASKIGPYLILVHSSEGNPEKHLLSRMEDVQTYGGFPVQGGGSAVGTYNGAEIWILHQYMGCTATQMWLECLKGTKVRYLIGLAEMTAYLDDMTLGDIVLPSSAIRGDLVTKFHAPEEVPASADPKLLRHMKQALSLEDWPVHIGRVYSGMPGGVGVHNPLLKERIWGHIQEGILGNAIETSVTYLEAKLMGIQAVEAWVISDDLIHGITDHDPSGHVRWQQAWDLMAGAALEVFHGIALEEGAL